MQVICPVCNAGYNIPDNRIPEGKRALATCKKCGEKITIEPGSQAEPAFKLEEERPAREDSVFDRDKFLLRQKHLAIKEKYYVWDEKGEPLLYIERPRHMFRNMLAIFGGILAGVIVCIIFIALAGIVTSEFLKGLFTLLSIFGTFATLIVVAFALSKKRHITFYQDDTKQESLLEILQDRKFHFFNATYTLKDPNKNLLARFRKNHLYNIIRKRWYCYTPEGSLLCMAKEDSILLSILRRFLGNLFGLLRTNFVIIKGEDDEAVIGEFNRKLTILDRYVLDMSADKMRSIDRRIALALGVMLDTGERR